MMSFYNGKALGTIGHLGMFSFHETKNYTSAGEGGLLIVNDDRFKDRAEIIREKGTNRSLFFRGMVDKYSWVDIGSSYLMNDVSAAYLWGNIEKVEKINKERLRVWGQYYSGLKQLEDNGFISLPTIPKNCKHNAHMFYVKTKNLKERTVLLTHLSDNDILSVFHYIPLHSSESGLKFGRFYADDKYTTQESERLIRLPMYFGLQDSEVSKVINSIVNFFE